MPMIKNHGHMLKDGKVILITGPAGSGKTSLAKRIAQNENWVHVSEDLHWVEIKKGHPAEEGRTLEEQQIIQPLVVVQVKELLSRGKNAVLEFINYENPPRPLMFYYEELQKYQCNILVKVLRPTGQVIMERKEIRGREDDKNIELEWKNTRHQLACLESDYIKNEWIIDNSNMTVEDIYTRYILAFIQQS
jgi:adenylate kinase family enzyme